MTWSSLVPRRGPQPQRSSTLKPVWLAREDSEILTMERLHVCAIVLARLDNGHRVTLLPRSRSADVLVRNCPALRCGTSLYPLDVASLPCATRGIAMILTFCRSEDMLCDGEHALMCPCDLVHITGVSLVALSPSWPSCHLPRLPSLLEVDVAWAGRSTFSCNSVWFPALLCAVFLSCGQKCARLGELGD